MAAKSKQGKNAITGKEPVFLVKPVMRNYGLDYLHIILIALVVVLIALSFALSTFKSAIVVTQSCNATRQCNPSNSIHNSTEALNAAEMILASYYNVNTSLSLIPYYSLVNRSTVDYMPSSREWLVVVPYEDPLLNNKTFKMSMTIYDSNLTLANAYLQTLSPLATGNNSVVALGTINLKGESACRTSTPIPVYVINDPYAPGTMQALDSAINLSREYGSKINVTYFFIFTGYSTQYYNTFGLDHTQQLGRYMECAAGQQRFPQFVSNLSIAYTGKPMDNETLYQIVLGSGLNITSFQSCMDNVSSTLNIESQFAELYHISSTPSIIVNCRYSTIPSTAPDAVNYALSHLQG